MTSDSTLRDFYELVYRPARHAGERHRRTRAEARSQINNLNRWWHSHCAELGLPLSEITLRAFDDDDVVTLAMAWLVDRERSPATANKLRVTLNAIWRLANKRGLVTSSPDNQNYRHELEDPIALMPDQKAAVIAQAQRVRGEVGDCAAGDWWLMLVLLLFNSGARITVLRHVQTASLDVARSELVLPARWQKQRRDQRVSLWASTRESIVRCRVVERRLVHLLDDWPFNIDTLRDHYTDLVLKPAGVPDTPKHKFHCLRKTVASEIAAVAPKTVAQEVLGHSSLDVTLRYLDPRYDSRPRVPELVKDPLPSPPSDRPNLSIYREEAAS
jgi:integrase